MEWKETGQIEDALFAYLQSLDTGYPLYLEYFPDSKNTALCYKRHADPVIKNKYISGAYKAEMSFSILAQMSRRDTRNMLDISRIFYGFADKFEQDTQIWFDGIELPEGVIPLSLEMTSSPAEYEGEGITLATFMASYTLTYEKKGKWS